MADRVKAHTRNGKPVQAHSRKSRPRKGLVSPGHSWHLAKKAGRAARRHKKGAALGFGLLAVGELGSWLVLDTAGRVFSLAGFLLLLAGGITLGATGRQAHPSEVRAFSRGQRASASAAEAHAQQARNKAATKRAGSLADQRKRHLAAQAKAKNPPAKKPRKPRKPKAAT